MTKREKADKLYLIFKQKFNQIRHIMNMGLVTAVGFNEKVDEYMAIFHPNVRVMPCDRLISLINDGVVDAIAVRNPENHDKVIVLELEYADKILVLGGLP